MRHFSTFSTTAVLAAALLFSSCRCGTEKFNSSQECNLQTLVPDSLSLKDSLMDVFMRRAYNAAQEGDSDYLRDICACTFMEYPRKAVGIQALYMCISDYRIDEVEEMMRKAGLSRKERRDLRKNPLFKEYFSSKGR